MSSSTPASPEKIAWLEQAIQTVPYARLMGIELEDVGVGESTLSLAIRPELSQNHGVVHGGALASLIDTATAFAILTLLEPEEKVTTVDLTISYLRPAIRGKLMATAKVIRRGRRLFTVSAEVFDDSKSLLTTALSTYIRV